MIWLLHNHSMYVSIIIISSINISSSSSIITKVQSFQKCFSKAAPRDGCATKWLNFIECQAPPLS